MPQRAVVVSAVAVCALVLLVCGAPGVSAAWRLPLDPSDGSWRSVTYYELMDLPRGDDKLSGSDVNKAYRSIAPLIHPDKFADRSKYGAEVQREAEKRFARLVDAMKTLRSRKTRGQYDELLKHGKVDYSDVDWEQWNYNLWKAYQEYAENFDHKAYEEAEADLMLWLGGLPTIAFVAGCVWWIYGAQIQQHLRDRQRRAKRREEREKANATTDAAAEAASPSGKRPHRNDKKRVAAAAGSAASPKSA